MRYLTRYFALVLAVLIASATVLTPVSAGSAQESCAAINGRTVQHSLSANVIMLAGDKLTIRATGASGTVIIYGPGGNITIPGSYSVVVDHDIILYFYASISSQGSVTLTVTCGPDTGSTSNSESGAGLPCASLYDGRINNSQELDCAAPIAIYLHSIDIFGINPHDGSGTQIMSINADIFKGPVPESNTLLSEGTNIVSGQWIRVYWLVKTGEVEVITAYPDGKPYIVVWPIAHPELLYHLAA